MNIWDTPPSDEVFNDLKEQAIAVWSTYDDTHGYATGKIDFINSLKNIGSNFMAIYGMFDWTNQTKLIEMIKPETFEALHARIYSPYEM